MKPLPKRFVLHKNPRQSRPKALLEGSTIFRESALSGAFSSPHTFCTPPISRPNGMSCFKKLTQNQIVVVGYHEIRKIPTPIKIKLALPPPPPSKKATTPPKRTNFMGMGVFQQKEPQNARRPKKWRSHFHAPELRAETLRTSRFF